MDALTEQLRLVNMGGGEKYIARHRQPQAADPRTHRGPARPGSPFLELAPLAAYGRQFPVGPYGSVAGIGVVEGVECMITGSDPTMRGGASNPYTLKKNLRIGEITAEPAAHDCAHEPGGADLPTQSEIFVPGGFRDITQASRPAFRRCRWCSATPPAVITCPA